MMVAHEQGFMVDRNKEVLNTVVDREWYAVRLQVSI